MNLAAKAITNPAPPLEFLRAVADPTRMAIFEALRLEGALTQRGIEELFPQARGGVAHHMRTLVNIGLAIQQGPGEWILRPGARIAWARTLDEAEFEAGTAEQPSEDARTRKSLTALLETIVATKRIGRIDQWERDKHLGAWSPEWISAQIGQDYAEKMTPDELDAIDADLQRVMSDARARIARRRAAEGTVREVPVFLAFVGFPFTLGW